MLLDAVFEGVGECEYPDAIRWVYNHPQAESITKRRCLSNRVCPLDVVVDGYQHPDEDVRMAAMWRPDDAMPARAAAIAAESSTGILRMMLERGNPADDEALAANPRVAAVLDRMSDKDVAAVCVALPRTFWTHGVRHWLDADVGMTAERLSDSTCPDETIDLLLGEIKLRLQSFTSQLQSVYVGVPLAEVYDLVAEDVDLINNLLPDADIEAGVIPKALLGVRLRQFAGSSCDISLLEAVSECARAGDLRVQARVVAAASAAATQLRQAIIAARGDGDDAAEWMVTHLPDDVIIQVGDLTRSFVFDAQPLSYLSAGCRLGQFELVGRAISKLPWYMEGRLTILVGDRDPDACFAQVREAIGEYAAEVYRAWMWWAFAKYASGLEPHPSDAEIYNLHQFLGDDNPVITATVTELVQEHGLVPVEQVVSAGSGSAYALNESVQRSIKSGVAAVLGTDTPVKWLQSGGPHCVTVLAQALSTRDPRVVAAADILTSSWDGTLAELLHRAELIVAGT